MIMYDATWSISETTLCITDVENNEESERQINIFPNPNDGRFTLVRENYFSIHYFIKIKIPVLQKQNRNSISVNCISNN